MFFFHFNNNLNCNFFSLFISDRKFALKARLNRALLVTLTLIKNNLTNFRNLQILLPVFKLYTNNSKWLWFSSPIHNFNEQALSFKVEEMKCFVDLLHCLFPHFKKRIKSINRIFNNTCSNDNINLFSNLHSISIYFVCTFYFWKLNKRTDASNKIYIKHAFFFTLNLVIQHPHLS